ncbi:hypothetical protein [Actinopolyspora mortivallis]|uniref:hypothetical protein n=1 Tax=Actinopolyspora mortivallis TaxID=33906 RepID=UPI0003A0AC08|nr:hypothetical protein [Actinopolyspora mortivallis]
MTTRQDEQTRRDDQGRTGNGAGRTAESLYHQARTPLLAALGAGDIAAHAVMETAQRVRDQITEYAGSARGQGSGQHLDLGELRERLRAGQLRELLDHYRDSAVRFYGYCGQRGERTLERLRNQPGVRRAEDQVGQAQHRVEEVVDEARELADDVLGRVSTVTRQFGEHGGGESGRDTEGSEDSERAEDSADGRKTSTSGTRKSGSGGGRRSTTAKKGGSGAEDDSAE